MQQRNKLSEAALPSKDENSKLKKEEPYLSASTLSIPGGKTSMESRVKKRSAPADDNLILLSDDESDEPKKPISERPKEHSITKQSEVSLRLAPSAEKASICNHTKRMLFPLMYKRIVVHLIILK